MISAGKVLAAVSQNQDIATIISEEPEVFGPFAEVFEFYRDYYTQHRSVPSLNIVNDYFPDASLEAVEGASAYHMERLRKEYIRGRMKDILLKTDDALDTYDPEEVLDKVSNSFAKLGKVTKGARDTDVMDPEKAIEAFMRKKEEIEANGGTLGIKTGFAPIDINFPTGLAGGQLVYFIGYSGKGKTYFANHVALNAWKQGFKVMFVSLEMNADEQRTRFMTILGDGEYEMGDFAQAQISSDSFKQFVTKKITNNPGIIVVDSEGVSDVTPNMVQAKIEKHRPDLIIWDYMQLGMNNSKNTEMTPRMMNLSRELKNMATRNNLPVIAISAVTDDDKNKKRDAPPTPSQFSWAKSMEYDAHLILAIHRYDNTNNVEIVSRKNRNGDNFAMDFEVDFKHGVWTMLMDGPPNG